MKSRITLRIGKILEALTAPVGHRVQRLSEGERAGRWKEAGRLGGWGASTQGSGLHEGSPGVQVA